MSKAVLTIDDAPTKITPKMIDYLQSKNITPVINFMGVNVELHFEEAVYAAKSGIVIGNHSYIHEHFSSMILEECRADIQKAEDLINEVYKAAGMERKYRVFRFPFGDKGGENEKALQKMLKDEFHFDSLDSSEVTFHFWKEEHLDKDISMHWSFDFLEYELSWNNGFTWDSILQRIHDKNPVQGSPLLGDDVFNVVLMHDMESTNDFMDEYYVKIIEYVLSIGVEFVEPKFVTFKSFR